MVCITKTEKHNIKIMKYYIFDVDGTLTPSRGLMDTEFKKWFLKFNSENPVYLATGSDVQRQ